MSQIENVNKQLPQFLTTEQVAEMLGLSVKYVIAHRARMPGVCKIIFGKRAQYRFNAAELNRALATGLIAPNPERKQKLSLLSVSKR